MVRRNKTYRRLGVATLVFFAVLLLADRLFPPPLERAEDLATIVTDRDGRMLHAFANSKKRWRFKTRTDDIDPAFIERLILIEDKRFRSHMGVDPAAVLRASLSSLKRGRIVSGASTITMQTARLLEPRPRTFGAKLAEMLRALQIERRLSKKEILELYLTLAPYGGNIEGVRAASLLYFDKEPGRLTDAEQALLIALPQAPEARRPDRFTKGHTGKKRRAAHAARQEILNRLAAAGAIGHRLADEAAEARLPAARTPLPAYAYHTTSRLAKEARGAPVRSTLDLPLQSAAEAMVAHYVERFDDGATAAVLIVENESRAVRAAVGSSGFDAPGGWIDLTRAVRSPGSTLKPFIYGAAFDDGLISGATVIEDMPRSFGGYTPENFDRAFRGDVRAREALQHSLNLPAVALLDRVGASRFVGLLKAAGVGLKTEKTADGRPGLAIALGGAGVTASEVAALYAGLADEGRARPLRWLKDAQADETGNDDAARLMSAATAARIGAILADAPSLHGRAPARLSASAPRVAFKTGTSYGYRDAWAAGHGAGYTVVVWVGRADGAPRPGATGRKTAAPLLFDIFDMLERQGGAEPALSPTTGDEPAPMIARIDRAPPARERAPVIVFPKDGVEIFVDKAGSERGYAFAARGGVARYTWYVNGKPVAGDAAVARLGDRRTVWRPEEAGFHDVTVVDAAGRAATSKVRVHFQG
ncbi:MAG: penicillin-binding protein 1C [Pseudomonadota bacterium]